MKTRARSFGGAGYAIGRKLKRPSAQTCQRCAHEFASNRLVPYCPPCFTAKRDERRKAKASTTR